MDPCHYLCTVKAYYETFKDDLPPLDVAERFWPRLRTVIEKDQGGVKCTSCEQPGYLHFIQMSDFRDVPGFVEKVHAGKKWSGLLPYIPGDPREELPVCHLGEVFPEGSSGSEGEEEDLSDYPANCG